MSIFKTVRYALFSLTLLVFLPGSTSAHPADEMPVLSLSENTTEFRQDRFGLFVHWGLYSQLCDGESVMKSQKLKVPEYERLASFFNPARFNAKEWVELVRAGGMRYLIFSAKSQEGFPMWDSSSTPWNVVKGTPFAHDVVKELSEQCDEQNVRFFINYTPEDWRLPYYIESGNTTATYTQTNLHLNELYTKYANIDGLLLDRWPSGQDGETQLEATYKMVRIWKPTTLIGMNHGRETTEQEDFQQVDWLLFANPDSDGDQQLTYREKPIILNDTINKSYGYRLTDHEYKSVRDVVHGLVRAAGIDANYVLHIAAMPNGDFEKEAADCIRRVGMWLAKHGETIYASRGGPVVPQPWGVTTHRRHKIYVHVLDPDVTTITLPLRIEVRSARNYLDESPVKFSQEESDLTLTLRPEQRGELERLIVLDTKRY